MLDKDIIYCISKKEFDKKVDKYFVNMTGNARTLHKTGGCCHAELCYAFITFSSEEEIEKYEAEHRDATYFKRCGICFKKRC